MCPAASEGEDTLCYGEDVVPLFEGEFDGDERAEGEVGDDEVARGEIAA